MKLLITQVLILTLFSCSSVRPDEKIKAWEEWKSRPSSWIEDHPYFKNLPLTKIKHEDKIETWLFRDQAHFQTGAYCQSLGGCLGMPVYNCDNVFSVKEGVILGFEQKGSCPGLKTIEVPKK